MRLTEDRKLAKISEILACRLVLALFSFMPCELIDNEGGSMYLCTRTNAFT